MSTQHRGSNLKIQDEGRLAELGYTQQLERKWGLLHNFGISFSIMVSSPVYVGGKGDADNKVECHHLHHNVRLIIHRWRITQTLTWHSLFSYGLNTGGPAVMSIGWIIASFFSTLLTKLFTESRGQN